VSLRARLLVVLFVIAAAVAGTVDTVTYLSLRSFLLQRVDAQLDAAHRPIVRSLGGRVPLGDIEALAPGLYIETRLADGTVADRAALERLGQPAMSPVLPAVLVVPDAAADGRGTDAARHSTVSSKSGGERFRVATWRLAPTGESLVLALPLDELESTMRRLLAVELVVTAAALAAGLLLARALMTVGLRPLDDIAGTAGAIAGGDLTKRVAREEATTEVGRLGAALNAMLGQIERAFAERRASEDRLRRFVADASHELRTPLTSIRAYAELFDRGADRRPEDLGRAMRGIEAEAERMGVLVDDLLLLARLDQGRSLDRAPVDLGALAAEAIDAARAVEPDRPLSVRVDGSVEVAGDPVRLRQLVDNLLANVRAHTPAGAGAEVSVFPEDGRGIVVVADHGPGISRHDQGRVFERFYRADPSRARDAGGAGLGLAIVAAIAAAHGGRSGVGTADGGGAEFRIELPLLTPDS
jgi:two-component system OmpR family sensor kinase